MPAKKSAAEPIASPTPERALADTRAWLNHAVIGLNLCPFAKAVQVKGQLRFVVSEATDAEGLLAALVAEMQALAAADPQQLDTTLLIHPQVFGRFADYNRFLGVADAALAALGLEGVLQIASFHPKYRFAGTAARDITNATNRSPWPMLHLLREASVERAVAALPQAEAIYEVNQRTLRSLGAEGWAALQARCRDEAETEADAAATASDSATANAASVTRKLR